MMVRNRKIETDLDNFGRWWCRYSAYSSGMSSRYFTYTCIFSKAFSRFFTSRKSRFFSSTFLLPL